MNAKIKSPKKGKNKWIAVCVILIAACFLALSLFSSCDKSTDFLYASSMDKPVDQVVVLTSLWSFPSEISVWITDDQNTINNWKDALKWRDSYTICCYEDTTHMILALQDGQSIYHHPYGGLGSGYNNWAFTWQQWQLVRRFQSSEDKSYQYAINVLLSTNLEQTRQEMQSESGWFVYENAGNLYVIAPAKLNEVQRDDAAKRWGIEFLMDR